METSNTIASFFDENGYYVARQVFSGVQLGLLEASFDRIVDRLSENSEENNARWMGPQIDELDQGESVILHTHNIQSYSAVWMKAMLDETFMDLCEAILGPDVILHHSKLFFKPPGNGAPFPMHQDWEHFPTLHDQMIAAVIHVNETTESSGCLRLYPGSHKRGRMEGMRGEGEGSRPRKEYSVADATPIEAQAGDVLFFSYLTVHGSTQNLSGHPRKTVLVQMHPGDDRVVDGNRHTNVKLALRGHNQHTSRGVMGRIR